MPPFTFPATHSPLSPLRRLALAMVLPVLGACATSRTTSPPDTPETLLRAEAEADLTRQLARIQRAYVKLAATRDDVVSALGIAGLATGNDPSLALPIDPVETCPHRVREHARGGDESHLGGHERRLASSLIMLDDELSKAGEPTLGCAH